MPCGASTAPPRGAQAERERKKAFVTLMALIEERARLGLPPLLAKPLQAPPFADSNGRWRSCKVVRFRVANGACAKCDVSRVRTLVLSDP